VNGQPTNYTLDLNTGLTQVLNDGTNTYTYGLGRISQTNTVTEYFLSDALGSVRQLTNASGVITYAKAYDPYGVVTSTNGASQSAYGFTGEQQSNNMVYLRSRYYSGSTGRFLTRDTWGGNPNSPMSYNKWNYVGSNPINRTDHTGRCWYPNQQTGGTSIDPTDSSHLMCSWFMDMLKNQGVNIPLDVTPQNWLNSIPPEHQAIITAFTTCPFENGTFLTPVSDMWMLIKFYTNPEWHYFSSSSAKYFDITLDLGVGTEYAYSCDNNVDTCTHSLGLGIGAGVKISKFKLNMTAGLEFDYETTGELRGGLFANGGPVTLFLGPTKISVSIDVPGLEESFKDELIKLGVAHTIEFGWQRDMPETYFALVSASYLRGKPYEEFAKAKLPFKPNSNIYYDVMGMNPNKNTLEWQHFLHYPNTPMYRFK